MARIGLYSSLVIVAFEIVAPFLFQLWPPIGFGPLLVLACLSWPWLRRGKNGYPWDATEWSETSLFIYGGERFSYRLRRAASGVGAVRSDESSWASPSAAIRSRRALCSPGLLRFARNDNRGPERTARVRPLHVPGPLGSGRGVEAPRGLRA